MSMLKINLMPDSARKASLSHLEQLHRTPLMWIGVGLMFAWALSLLIPILLRHGQLQQLNAKVSALEPKRLEVDQIQRTLQELRTQEAGFKSLKQEQSHWSKRLNTLSDVTPDGIWFTELTLDKTKGLIINGSAISQGGSEMIKVGQLVQDLKNNADFSKAVKDIQIESIKRIQERDIEIVQFTLACALVEGATP
jgi:Tfp pilus assembly protein PilN